LARPNYVSTTFIEEPKKQGFTIARIKTTGPAYGNGRLEIGLV